MGAKADEIKAAKKEDLLNIADLNAEKIKVLTEKQLQSFTKTLKLFSNVFPMQKGQLESAFRNKDYATVLQCLRSIENRLSQIHADAFASACKKQIDLHHDLNNIRHEKLEVFIDYFISNLVLFFSDIQDILEELELKEIGQKQEMISDKLKEKISHIEELDSDVIKKLTDEQLNTFIENLNAFSEDYPTQEAGLKNSIKHRQYASTLRWLVAIQKSLAKIHAANLADECMTQIEQNKDIRNIRHEKLEVFTNYFLASISILSTDIAKLNLPVISQIAKHLVK
jgi:hypothetical protein